MHHARVLVVTEVPHLLAADTAHGCTACRTAAPFSSRRNRLGRAHAFYVVASQLAVGCMLPVTGRWCAHEARACTGQQHPAVHLLFSAERSRFPMHHHNARRSSETIQSACPVDPTTQQLTRQIPAPQIWTASLVLLARLLEVALEGGQGSSRRHRCRTHGGKAMADQHGSTQQGSNRSQPAAAHALMNMFLALT